MPALIREDRLALTSEREERPRRLGRLEVRRFKHPESAPLDGWISATWARLVETGSAECPVCAAEIDAARACGGCGSELL